LTIFRAIKEDILLRKQGKVTKLLPQKDITYKFNISNHISQQVYREAGAVEIGKAYETDPIRSAELMRTRYCIRYELGLCPVHHGAKVSKPLFLLNNGQRFALHFDCKVCEMTVTEA
jgi:putative protease